jgi:ketosteroid isomerase-like protein/uncharacterized glyoxalase superfamily protein PhnB
MSAPARRTVDCEVHHTGLPVSDVSAAVMFYTEKLGFELGFTHGEPVSMAGVNLGQAQIFLEQGVPNPAGCSLYFVVGDADELFEFQRASGVEVVAAPADKPYGLRDYRVRDPYGYVLRFGHYIYTVGEPIAVERVDVPVRLERRLAGLLADLAEHKRMSLSSCLEEILLHTNEGVGPHTKSTLRHIALLKEQHGIDYDSHGSYRFAEREGRAESAPTTALLEALLEAFNRHDLDAIMDYFAEDCVLEMPRGPKPWGARFVGAKSVREGLASRFAGIPDVHYGDARHVVSGDLGVSQWTLTGTTREGKRLEVRGLDVLTFRDGKVVLKDSYWKIVE